MSTEIFEFVVCLCIVRLTCAQVGERCFMREGDKEGTCRLLNDCSNGQRGVGRGSELSLCGFYDINPIVCCESEEQRADNNYQNKNYHRRTNGNTFLSGADIIFPEEQQYQQTQQPAKETNVRLRISEKKCEEYSESVTGVVQVLPLVTHVEPISIKVDKCDYNSVPLIVGGEPASAGEFPFMAAIGFNSKDHKWRCGGTLISNRFVITAAHCTFTSDAGAPKLVRLGTLYLSQNNGNYEDYRVSNVIPHPNYRYPEKYNDIALLKVNRDITFTDYIRPACLYTENTPNFKSGVATGWGKLDFAGESSDRLMKVTLDFYENEVCQKAYQNLKGLPNGITSSMLCAGELKGGKDTCQGDSGGPLLVTKKGNQCKFYLVGVTSFGKSCGQVNTPAVYTRISKYVPWIEKHVWPTDK